MRDTIIETTSFCLPSGLTSRNVDASSNWQPKIYLASFLGSAKYNELLTLCGGFVAFLCHEALENASGVANLFGTGRVCLEILVPGTVGLGDMGFQGSAIILLTSTVKDLM